MCDMKFNAVLMLFVVICTLRNLHAARILAVFQHNAESNFIMFETLLKALAARGHDVVVVSHFPQHSPVKNYTDISISGSSIRFNNSLNISVVEKDDNVLLPFLIIRNSVETCKMVLEHRNIETLLKSEEKFDLIINEIFGSDCFLGFVHKFKAPHISLMTSVPLPWSNERTANPDNPAHVQNYCAQYTDRMTFWERLQNTVQTEMIKWVYYYFSELPTHRIARKYFGDDLPALSDIARNVSLVLVNSHFSVNYPRPTVPVVVEVGGLHIQSASKLPQFPEERKATVQDIS
ncbi:2-hydroxyacylsphingosine 1-beta-galactosyltransferase-like isoform X2 [Cryptotermes secundus]|uniref:2-hydroxyacylsphingosine 1-beta-galactosyltransferase-like isoform X2 n=1 Tax=Cryptotermes secundus TaxID=105785 RepID=UPI001454CBE1|nr:2-hydroxyacylsphingosine 1-beta-galactosyltransferase-like isoform X2 [Cryptotermes secundus]